MCGISGIVNFKTPQISRDTLQKMNDTLARRGPDGEGFFFANHVGFGHRRLAIIDLESGAQPITSACGRYTITFNGEIYNYLELRKNLEGDGVAFRTHSDTEVLLALFMRKGSACLADLNGMFAFAVWDAETQTLFAARDRAGKKPFYYATVGDNFIFGSELKALLQFPGLTKKISPSALAHFFTYEYIPAPFAMIDGTHKLRQAHYLTVTADVVDARPNVVTSRYWAPPLGDDLTVSENEASRTLLELLDKAVQYRLISDVPVGVFLSGGIDSSSVVALMARHRTGKDIATFSINFQEESYDESLYSETVAKKFGTNHHQETLTAATMLDILPQVANYVDEPFADASILPTYLLSRFTRQHVTVALGGDGADELLAGYPTFVASRFAGIYQRMPYLFKKSIRGLSQWLPASEKNMSFDFKLRQFIKGAEQPGIIKNQIWLAAVVPQDQPKIFSRDFFETRLAGVDTLKILADEMQFGPQHPDKALLYFYQKFYMCDDILFKVDRASMANSLEVRAPFLDRDVVDFASRLPYAYKLKGITTKYILKKTMNRLLPAMITQRPKKGFGIPLSGWLKKELQPLMATTLAPERLARDGIFNPTYVQTLIAEHQAGKNNHRKPLFALLMLHLWMDEYLPGN